MIIAITLICIILLGLTLWVYLLHTELREIKKRLMALKRNHGKLEHSYRSRFQRY